MKGDYYSADDIVRFAREQKVKETGAYSKGAEQRPEHYHFSTLEQLHPSPDDCDRFLPDFDDLPEAERQKAMIRAINRKLAAAAPEDPVTWSFLEEFAEGKRYNYASDFVADAKAEWERRQRYGDCD